VAVFVPLQPNFDTFLNSPAGEVGRWLRRRGLRVKGAARRQVGVRTGALRASIHLRHARDTRGQFVEIGSALSYALLHHEGSKPHVIVPVRRTHLRFFSKGFMVHSVLVNHPGTRPNRYLSDNLRRIID
jgi:hypothetical protein